MISFPTIFCKSCDNRNGAVNDVGVFRFSPGSFFTRFPLLPPFPFLSSLAFFRFFLGLFGSFTLGVKSTGLKGSTCAPTYLAMWNIENFSTPKSFCMFSSSKISLLFSGFCRLCSKRKQEKYRTVQSRGLVKETNETTGH